ncbi:VWA domain-containing protein [Streptococcus sp. 20-1249]|uniref:VWA domain-containing protein n=1 Tax=Streptococcus hepaticus TaxID=3349163 RepID=UPI0037497F33
MKKGRKGFTLVELMVSIIVMSMVTVTVGIIFQTTFTSKDMVEREAAIQAELRTSMQLVDKTIQNATAVFILDESKYDGTDKKLTDGWSYIGLSGDKQQLINYVWNKSTKKWDKRQMGVQSLYDMTMDLHFDSVPNYEDNRLVTYDLSGQFKNSNNKFKLETAATALNSKQVFNQVAKGKAGTAIAYRNDPIEGQMNTAISFVFDTSGSMNFEINGKQQYTNPSQVRLRILKDKAKVMIDELAALGNVSVNLAHFANVGGYLQEEFVDLRTGSEAVKQKIESMTATGGTNPGDGLRHGMVSLKKNSAQFKYVVILSDGLPNMYTVGKYTSKWPSRRYTDAFEYANPEFDLSENVGQNAKKDFYFRNSDVLPEAIRYTGEVSRTFSKGIRRVSMIGFSGVESEKAYGQKLTDSIKNGNVDANYYDASNQEELAKVFSDIKKQIEQDLWFVVGP